MNVTDMENIVMQPQNNETYINRQIVNRTTIFPKPNNSMSPEVEQISKKPHMSYVTQYVVKDFNTMSIPDDEQKRLNKLLWVVNYAEDIYENLRKAELRRRALSFRTTQYASRPTFLSILLKTREKFKLSRTTLHLAVYYMDNFLDEFTVYGRGMILTAMGCMSLAAKIEENGVHTPRFNHFNSLTNNMFKIADYQQMELKLLETFGFDMIRPTVATFAEYFIKCLLTPYDYEMYNTLWNMQNGFRIQRMLCDSGKSFTEVCNTLAKTQMPRGPFHSYDGMLFSMSDMYFKLVDITLQYIEFANIRPSVVAAGCVATTRQIYGIQPMWNVHLTAHTTYTMNDLTPVFESLWIIHLMEFKNVNIPRSLLTNSLLRMNRIQYNLPVELSVNSSQNISRPSIIPQNDMVTDNNNDTPTSFGTAFKRRRTFS